MWPDCPFSHRKEGTRSADCFKTAFCRSRRGSDSCPSAGKWLLWLYLLLLEVSLSRRAARLFSGQRVENSLFCHCASPAVDVWLSPPFHETTWQTLAVSSFSNSVYTHLLDCPAVVPNSTATVGFLRGTEEKITQGICSLILLNLKTVL